MTPHRPEATPGAADPASDAGVSTPDAAPAGSHLPAAGPVVSSLDEAPTDPVVDFPRTLRRLRTSLSVIAGVVVVAWVVLGAVGDGWTLRSLAELAGFGLFAAFAVEVVVVGGSAARGMLAAGERGDRLAGADVSILPPQLGRRRRDRPDA